MGLIHIVNVGVTFHHLGLHPLNPIEQPGYFLLFLDAYLNSLGLIMHSTWVKASISQVVFVGSTPNVSILEPKKNHPLYPLKKKMDFFCIFSHQILLN